MKPKIILRKRKGKGRAKPTWIVAINQTRIGEFFDIKRAHAEIKKFL